ncbi:sphinganine C4-monooxygenase 2-like [Asparagus officinalis]|uniref:sphinganine C4-monooxygenase 2-like n=1 Tax=Asparagus officinalis TaxID=4686 RepID=UPI00098E0171|nr:sphinganine C4-monooxygenase 2-like [Asparagus officinalis]
MDFLESDEFLSVIIPVTVYWVYAGLYEMLGNLDKYRLHSKKDEETKNLVPKREVIKGVLLQQAIQAAIALTLFKAVGNNDDVINNRSSSSSSNTTYTVAIALQFLIAMLVHDTWQYFVHRYMHVNKFLYRNFHSWHHRLVAPYAYAAQYNHPIDGILTETLAGALAFYVSGMSAKTSIFFFTFATIKGIDDHCGIVLPWNPLHVLFHNNTAYHEIHHQLVGSKCNFAQPFFVTWDKIMGTYVGYKIERREGGGYEARMVKDARE